MSVAYRAKGESEKRARAYTGDGREGQAYEDGFIAGVEWATSRPVTDAEIEAMQDVLAYADGISASGIGLRDALTAAREAQR